MRSTRMWGLAAVLGLIAARGAGADQITGYNEDATLNVAAHANDFEIVLPGNQTVGNFVYGFPNPNPATVLYQGGSNTTTITFSGGTVAQGTKLHFGYTVAGGVHNTHGLGPPDTLAKVWTLNGNVVESATPGFTVSLANITGAAAGVRYLVIYAAATPVGGGAVGDVHDWFTIRLPAGQSADVILSNASTQDETISGARYLFLTESDIGLPETDPNFGSTLLNDLNDQHLPPTDPRFQSLNIPDGTDIKPGGLVTTSVPEPSSLALCGAAVATGLVARLRRRRRRRSGA